MEPAQDNANARRRILDISAEMFAQKGFAATRVNEIAAAAGVNKALIYYYFPSKEAILDHLVESFFDGIATIGMEFIREILVDLKKQGRMDILADRFEFTTKADLMDFIHAVESYYSKLLDNLLPKRKIIRIIMMESLANRKHKGELFRFFMMSENSMDNPMYKAIHDVDDDFNYGTEVVFRKFFFSMLPLMNFAVYFDDYAAVSGQEEATLKAMYVKSVFSMWLGHINGKSIMIQLDPPPRNSQ